MALAYSNKQHRGNTGEGQIHLHSTNIIYHLTQHFSAAYTYHDFVQKLKSELLNNQKKAKMTNVSNESTPVILKTPRQKSLW